MAHKCAKCGGDVVSACDVIDTFEMDGDDQLELGIDGDDVFVSIGDGVSVGVLFCRHCYAIEDAWIEDYPGMVRGKDPNTGIHAEHESNAKTCDVCARRTPNVLVMCDDCDPTIDGKVAGEGSGVARLQAEKEAMEARLAYLNTWLESRGLPLTWEGRMTAARFIAIEERVINPDTADAYGESHIAGSYIGEEYRWAGDIRWDHAKPEDRVEALKLDAARESK